MGSHEGLDRLLTRRELRAQREATDAAEAPQEAAAPAVAAPAVESRPATILTVCTGNICRSPMGEVLLRAGLRNLPVRVHSAGTHALVDHIMTEPAQELALRLGAEASDAAAHRARYLIEPILAETDLVLAMSREHRQHVVQMMPSVLRRTFTVREFARLAATLSDAEVRAAADAAGADAGERLKALAALVGGQRGLVIGAPEDDDVIDPYRRSAETYQRSADQLEPAIAEAVRVVRVALG